MRRGGRKRRSQKHRGRRRVAHTSTAGAKLPEELFEVILWYSTHYHDHVEAPCFDIPNKHAMSSFALVSKYFAKCCRPDSWRLVELRSAEALRRLLDLLDDGHKLFGCSVLAFTDRVYLDPAKDDPPWIHQVGMVLFARMQQLGENHVPDVSLGAVDSHDIPNGPASSLPRTLPHIIFQHIHSFSVKARFKEGKSIIRCLSSMRHLTHITLQDVVYDTIPDQRDMLRLSSSTTWKTVFISEPQTMDNAKITMLQVMFMTYLGSEVPLPHRQSECACITGLFVELYRQWDGRNLFHISTGGGAIPSGFGFNFGALYFSIKPPPARSMPSSAINGVLYDCVIRFNKRVPDIRLDPWSAVAADFVSLRYLRVLGLHFFTLDDMEIVSRNLHPLLRHLHASGRTLEFCVITGEDPGDDQGIPAEYLVVSTWAIDDVLAKFRFALGDPDDQEEDANVPGATGDNGTVAGETGGEADEDMIANNVNPDNEETDRGDIDETDGSIPGRNSGQTEDAAVLEGTVESNWTSTGENESQPASTVLEGSSTERVLVEATWIL